MEFGYTIVILITMLSQFLLAHSHRKQLESKLDEILKLLKEKE